MKSVLFYISRYPGYGGIEKVTTILANHWADTLGWNVVILSCNIQSKDLLEELSSKVWFHKIEDETDIESHANIKQINRIVNEHKIDNIIYQDSYALSHRLLRHIANRPKIIVVEHNTPDCSWLQYKFRWRNEPPTSMADLLKKCLYPYYYCCTKRRIKAYHSELYNMCDSYVLLSNAYLPILREYSYCQDLEKCVAINNPVTVNPTSSIKRKKEVVFVGRLDVQKGCGLMVRIWQDFYSKNSDWHLTVVGDGDWRVYMEKELLNCNVSFAGYRQNPQPYISDARILCMTSVYEGWPLVLFEAMAQGTVPFAFNSFGSLKEMVVDKDNACVVRPFDVHEYVERLCRLVADERLLESMSRNAINHVKGFHVSELSAQWEKILISS